MLTALFLEAHLDVCVCRFTPEQLIAPPDVSIDLRFICKPPCRTDLNDEKAAHESAFLRIERRILSACFLGLCRVSGGSEAVPWCENEVLMHCFTGAFSG